MHTDRISPFAFLSSFFLSLSSEFDLIRWWHIMVSRLLSIYLRTLCACVTPYLALRLPYLRDCIGLSATGLLPLPAGSLRVPSAKRPGGRGVEAWSEELPPEGPSDGRRPARRTTAGRAAGAGCSAGLWGACAWGGSIPTIYDYTQHAHLRKNSHLKVHACTTLL